MTSLRDSRVLPSALLLLLFCAGCHDDLTQVVLVIQSDLTVPTEVDGMDVAAIEGPLAPPVNPFFIGTSDRLLAFPVSVGFTSGGRTKSFSVVVRLFRGVFQVPNPPIVISRAAVDIGFVDEQTMMLVLPLKRVCACQGTSCPNPGNPECDKLDGPALEPFDPAVAPPSTMMGLGGGGVVGGGGTAPPR
jgi:hypothetical protein